MHWLMGRIGNARNFFVSYILQTRTESLKPYMIFHDRMRCLMVCKISFTNWNAKVALLCASMVVTYYIRLFRTGADRHNGILMSLFLLVAETIRSLFLWINMFTIALSFLRSAAISNATRKVFIGHYSK